MISLCTGDRAAMTSLYRSRQGSYDLAMHKCTFRAAMTLLCTGGQGSYDLAVHKLHTGQL